MAGTGLDAIVGKTIARTERVDDQRVELFFTDGTSMGFTAMAGGDYNWCDLDVSGLFGAES